MKLRKTMLFFIVIVALIALSGQTLQAQESPHDPRIIGGQPVENGEFPWVVALVNRNTNGQFCGGALIAEQWVLTAAHCFFDQQNQQDTFATDVRIVMGTVNVADDSGQSIDVVAVNIHPNYVSGNNNNNDIALLKLAQTADTSNPNIGLITVAVDDTMTTPGTNSIIAGWGSTTADGSTPSDTMNKISLPLISQNQCAEVQNGLTDNMLCAGGVADEDSCSGDSGGPLFVANGDSYVQVGITSFGPDPCAQADEYGVYTRVARYKAWIQGYVGGGSIGDTFVYLPMVMKLPSAVNVTSTPTPESTAVPTSTPAPTDEPNPNEGILNMAVDTGGSACVTEIDSDGTIWTITFDYNTPAKISDDIEDFTIDFRLSGGNDEGDFSYEDGYQNDTNDGGITGSIVQPICAFTGTNTQANVIAEIVDQAGQSFTNTVTINLEN